MYMFTTSFGNSEVSIAQGLQGRRPLASYPGPFEGRREKAWYPLFAHAYDFLYIFSGKIDHKLNPPCTWIIEGLKG